MNDVESMNLERLENAIRELLLVSAESVGDGALKLIGGVPEEVVVQVKGAKVTVSVYSMRWQSVSSLVVHPIPIASLYWRRIPSDRLRHELKNLIETAREIRRSKYRQCCHCGESKPPEWLHDEQTCHSCAERVLGVIH